MKVTLISADSSIIATGTRVLSAFLKKHGIDCNCIFMSSKFSFALSNDESKVYSKKILEQICKIAAGSNIIGVSSMSLASENAKQIITYLKKTIKAPIVWGGIHATINPEKCIQYADIICIGEGEETMLELVNAISQKKSITKIKSLWIKKGNKIFKNDIRPLIEDINSLPFPDYDLENKFVLDNNEIIPFSPKHVGNSYGIQGSRGCPFNCAYCCNSFLRKFYSGKGKYVRQRSIDHIISELKSIKKKFPEINHIDFTDDVLIYRSKEELTKFAELYKKHIDFHFNYYVSPQTLTEEKLKILLTAGKNSIIMGIQSGSERINKEVFNRFTSREKIIESAKILNKYSSELFEPPIYDFIFFNPYETQKDVLETINLIMELPQPFKISANCLVFFPGIEFYEKALKDNLIEDNPKYLINYVNFREFMKLKRPNKYLSSIIFWMRSGITTNTKIGIVPRFAVKFLCNKQVIWLNEHFPQFYLMINFLKNVFRRKNKYDY